MDLLHVRQFLSRPDVRRARVRLLSRRLRVAFLEKVSPRRLARERDFGVVDGYRVRLPLDDTVARELFVHGAFEFGVGQQLLRSIGPGSVVVDVGAHVGTFTLLAASRVGPSGRVIAFEPNMRTRERLLHNIAMNRFEDRVTVLPYALFDEDARVSFGSPSRENSGMSQLGAGGAEVECRTLDGVLAELRLDEPVSVIKIDVEGYEPHVVRGAHRCIADDQPVLIVELNDSALPDFLRERFDYRVSLIADDGSLTSLTTGREVVRAVGTSNFVARPAAVIHEV